MMHPTISICILQGLAITTLENIPVAQSTSYNYRRGKGGGGNKEKGKITAIRQRGIKGSVLIVTWRLISP